MRSWARVRELAERTPEQRNRYVDFLRALSIGAVVFGHWLIAAPWVDHGELRLDHMLAVSPWTQWLTLLFQVMPVFFMVGGYSNSASWEAARRAGRPYGEWVADRLRRLVGPILPLIVFWALLAVVARRAGVSPAMIRFGSQAALIPVWFLAVYLLVVVLVPVTHNAWRRFGMGSFWALAVCAVAIDVARFGGGMVALAWTNYVFIWLAVHQLGYAWRDGLLAGPRRAVPWLVGGLATLYVLIEVAGYPLSMVSVPGEAVSNTRPPSLAMLALGMTQGGLLLSLEGPARRWLSRTGAWAATILVNATIMSVYLWHVTTMILLTGLLNLLGGFGLRLEPGTARWWAARPLWMGVLAATLLAVLQLVGRFERLERPQTPIRLSVWRVAVGSVLVCTALALVAIGGVGDDGPAGFRVGVVAMALVGAALVGVLPGLRRPLRRSG